ncbi:Do family serine endopeptidase [Aureimonas sp. Leaf324]|jgi:serine protease Do|uniref:Do family serine endopeptidase n=1 Tax=Aureimonas sp. Leaf324 TaxID=1736336 RepID=UPI0006F3BD75|nr:Do family serine endopeptidase [Aureimonas sp. Leaf324]KQQ80572.1 serine protease [Aureimonas sp. Leaf324]
MPRTHARLASSLAGAALALLALGAGPGAAQGVIAPPSEGQPIAPQPPTAATIDPAAPGVPAQAGSAQPRMIGPASVADLADRLLGAVVNISTSQKVEGGPPRDATPPLTAPDGSPLQDFFNDLLNGKEGDGENRVQSLGSGFVLDPSGIVVTNNHVIADADEITVNFADGRQLDATVVGVDPKTDLAVLKVESPTPLAAVKFGDSDAVRIGDWVMAIGNPFGLGGSVTVGIVSARGRNIQAGPYDNFIQTDAAINRGNSGGPLFDMYGNVIGINTAIISPTGGSIGIGFAIPALLAQNVVDQLREYGETRRGWLGIRLQEVTDEIAEGLGLPNARGALVMGIIPEGPADNGQIEIGDVVTRFDGREIATSRDLPRIVAETEIGKTVTLDILRKESLDAPAKPVSVQVTLGRLEDADETDAGEDDTPTDADAAAPEAPAAPAPNATLGLQLSDVSDELKKRFDLPDDFTGVLVTEVAPNSAAGEKGIEPGTVIKEVGQEAVKNAADAREKLTKLKADGRRNALLLLADRAGDLRFAVVPID